MSKPIWKSLKESLSKDFAKNYADSKNESLFYDKLEQADNFWDLIVLVRDFNMTIPETSSLYESHVYLYNLIRNN